MRWICTVMCLVLMVGEVNAFGRFRARRAAHHVGATSTCNCNR